MFMAILFLQASLGIANLIVMAMVEDGVDEEEARSKIWLVDSRGLIVKDRPKGGITGHKEVFAHEHEPMDDLEEIVREIKPTTLIGKNYIIFPSFFLRGVGIHFWITFE